MLKYKIKKGDTVKVICGKNIGKSGNVIEVDRNKGRLLIEGINLVKKTFRKSKEHPNGGINEVEAFINISNAMLICPKCKKTTRVGFKIIEEKKERHRICKKCKAELE